MEITVIPGYVTANQLLRAISSSEHILVQTPYVGSSVTYQGKSYLVGRITIEMQLSELSDSPEKAQIYGIAKIYPIDEEGELLDEKSESVDISDLVTI